MASETDPAASTQSREGDVWLKNGAVLGTVAAVAYSVTNLALRHLSDTGTVGGQGWDLWVTAMKTVPTGVIAWVLVISRVARSRPAFPPLRLLPTLIFAALVMQFGGNLAFQMALSYLGLGITVPLVFACIICVGAIMGRVVLGDPITVRILISMAVMAVAIVMLSVGTMSEDSTWGSEAPLVASGSRSIVIGVCIAALSGCSYGAVGVLIRSLVRSVLPVESTLIVFSTVGGVMLGTSGIALSGWSTIRDNTMQDWPMLLVAGSANAIAFFALAHALRFIDVNRMNVINASQNAMCAIGAVFLFHEQLNGLALCGIGLTILGLIVLGWQRHPKECDSAVGERRHSPG